jgi:hypothetical protein
VLYSVGLLASFSWGRSHKTFLARSFYRNATHIA